MRIVHLSDLHFGRIIQPEIVDRLVDEVNTADVSLVAISGDLTQRARKSEFQQAAAMLERFDAATIVVPGNHDVYPWWRPISRIFRPFERYKEVIGEDLMPSYEQEGLAVLGVNSAYGRTVKGGKISRADLDAIRTYFEAAPPSAFRVMMLHHHLTKIQALGPHDIARRARKALDIASETGVDLILCGHLHISHIEPIEIIPDEQRVVIVSAGTATSSRGRRSNRKTNFYNYIEIEDEMFTIEERRYHPDRQQFVTDSTTRFERVTSAASTNAPSES